MTWGRMIRRNQLEGGYTIPVEENRSAHLLAGDLERIGTDTRDEHHLKQYAHLAGVPEQTVKRIFDAFFHEYDTPWQMNHSCEVCEQSRKQYTSEPRALPEDY